MKKRTCEKFGLQLMSFIFASFGIMHLLGITFWTRDGWQEPNTTEGIFFIVLSLIIYFAVNYFCRNPLVLKCISCKEVFNELDTKDKECPNCKGKLISVEAYYQNLTNTRDYEKTQSPRSPKHATSLPVSITLAKSVLIWYH